MASEPDNQVSQFLSNVLRFLKIVTLNSWRRLCILGRYTTICLHQQCLRRAWLTLGKQICQAVAGGEVNPMLLDDVQDSLTRAQVIQETKDQHYQAIAALRRRSGPAGRPGRRLRQRKLGSLPKKPPGEYLPKRKAGQSDKY